MDELAGLTRLYGISCFFYPRRAFECLFDFLYRLLIFLSFCFKNVKFGRLYLKRSTRKTGILPSILRNFNNLYYLIIINKIYFILNNYKYLKIISNKQ